MSDAAPAPTPAEKPTIRLLHHLARTGGTVIAKCLGSMAGTALLSEIHPAGGAWFNPFQQADRWHGLLTKEDLAALRTGRPMPFAAAIMLIERRARERGLALVIRDWTHLDYTAVPFLPQPSFRLTLALALAPQFNVLHAATVRHPIDQWLSLERLGLIRGRLSLADYLIGYRRFAEVANRIGYLRYEDFAADPAKAMALLCRRLQLPYDPGFQQRWMHYDKITGDTPPGPRPQEIRPPRRKPCPPALIDAFGANADYRRAIELLGYGHPQ